MNNRNIKSSRKYFYFLLLLIPCLIANPQPKNGLIESLSVGYNHITSSCTIFTAAIGDTVYFGNNEDYKLENAYLWYMPNQTIYGRFGSPFEMYGSVFLGFDNNDYPDVDTWEQGGMNEHGLCFDANGLPDRDLHMSGLFPITTHALAQVLWDCKNVTEVIAWYQTHRWFTMGGQIHYADSTGEAVVVSANATGHWAFARKNSTYLVSTNFNLADFDGHYPCNRYTTATQMLGEITTENDLTVSACANILYEVHQEGEYATKYSNIFDTVNLDIYFNHGEKYSEQTKINLMERLSDDDSFEQKNSFMGIYGANGHVLVKTEKIDTLVEKVGINISIGVAIFVISNVIINYIIVKKKKK